MLIDHLTPQIALEQEFISDFLHINDAGVTFADCMNLDNYFCRQAARYTELSQSTLKIIRGAMDLIFGFLLQEIKDWLDGALQRDSLYVVVLRQRPLNSYRRQIVGIIAVIDRYATDESQIAHPLLQKILHRQQQRLRVMFERQIVCLAICISYV